MSSLLHPKESSAKHRLRRPRLPKRRSHRDSLNAEQQGESSETKPEPVAIFVKQEPSQKEPSRGSGQVKVASPALLPYARPPITNPAAQPLSPSQQRQKQGSSTAGMSDMRRELLRRLAAKREEHQEVPPSLISPPRASRLDDLRRKPSSPAVQGYVPEELTSYGVPLKRRKALLIGIGYRENKHLEYLPGCTNDVRHMFTLLTSNLFNFPRDCVKVLSDEIDMIESVKAEAPTRSNILRDMAWLTSDLNRGDGVVFFFAGHGDYIEDKSGDEVETGYDQVRCQRVQGWRCSADVRACNSNTLLHAQSRTKSPPPVAPSDIFMYLQCIVDSALCPWTT